MKIRTYTPADKNAVIALWESCGLVKSWNDPVKDIQRKLDDSADWFFVGELHNEVIASMMVGYDGHRGWVNYLAVADAHRKKNFGQTMMQRAEALLKENGCPKLNLQVRSSNTDVIDFYESIGYSRDASVSLGKRLIPDE